MGGRGSKGNFSQVKGLSVRVSPTMSLEYRQVRNRVYSIDENGTPQELPFKSLKEVSSRAQKQGFEIKKLTQKDLDKRESQRKRNRAETDRILNQESARSKVGDQINKAYRNFKKSFKRR